MELSNVKYGSDLVFKSFLCALMASIGLFSLMKTLMAFENALQ
jgi:hypothetical protein